MLHVKNNVCYCCTSCLNCSVIWYVLYYQYYVYILRLFVRLNLNSSLGRAENKPFIMFKCRFLSLVCGCGCLGNRGYSTREDYYSESVCMSLNCFLSSTWWNGDRSVTCWDMDNISSTNQIVLTKFWVFGIHMPLSCSNDTLQVSPVNSWSTTHSRGNKGGFLNFYRNSLSGEFSFLSASFKKKSLWAFFTKC